MLRITRNSTIIALLNGSTRKNSTHARDYSNGADLAYPARFTTNVLGKVVSKLKSYPRITLKRDPNKPVRRAAVLIPFMNTAGQSCILYTKRPETMRTHSGQVSFPGGTEDPEDGGDLIQTAIRETTEEIGLSRDKIQVLGMFDEAMSINGLYVTPVLAFCGDYNPAELRPSPDEIADIFCVTIADLTAPGARIEESLARGKVARFVKSPYPVRAIPDIANLVISSYLGSFLMMTLCELRSGE